MSSSKFRQADRHQKFLLPPDLKKWLPEDHLVYFLLDAIRQTDTSAFFEGYSEDLRGEKAYSPEVMIPLIVYAYIDGVRSSREIERRCERDLSYRVAACNETPDHSTICRFRNNNREAIQTLFEEVLRLCAEADLVEVGTISLDGTKMKANASFRANQTYETISEKVDEMIEEAEQIDREEDREHGEENRGDELPESLADRESRRKRLKECKERIEQQAERKAEQKREQIRQRKKEEETTGKKKRGPKPDPPDPTPDDEARANPTDPESRIMKDHRGYIQGYNLQAAVNGNQIILAAEATNDENDRGQLEPMVKMTKENLGKAGVDEEIETAVADNGYWNERAIKEVEEQQKVECLIATEKGSKMREKFEGEGNPQGRMPEEMTFQEQMDRRLLRKEGRRKYKKRGQTIEPVFGQIKERMRCDRFRLRGTENVDVEWKLMAIGHNLKKLWRNTRRN